MSQGPAANADELLLPRRARDFAIAAHGFQRYGERPYAFHLDMVAQRVRARGPLYEAVAYLHDVLEDTGVSREDLEREFGEQVARCVATISDPDNRSREERKASINRQLAAVSEGTPDWPALVVKVADRLCNIEMCAIDGRVDLLGRYRKEHADFRAAAWRPPFRAAFEEMERVLRGGTDQTTPPPSTNGEGNLIDEFVAHFTEDWDDYRKIAFDVAQRCEATLLGHGLQAIVSARAKSPERLRAKMLRRQGERGRPYADARDVFDDIVDLAGIRIALYFPDDAEVLDALLRRDFDVIATKIHAGDQPATGDYPPRFSGYWATHYRVRHIRKGEPITVEIQVASVLMHAFSHVAHDLIYKPQSGTLSWTEYALLDQLNGLVLAGETALDQLHKAIRARLRRHDSALADHFELGAWLTRWARLQGMEQIGFGRLDRLFALLKTVERTRPSEFEPLLRDLEMQRPVADQVIERLLLEHPERASQWQLAILEAARANPYDDGLPVSSLERDSLQALSAAWARLEAAAAECLTGRPRASFPLGKRRLAALPLDVEDLAGLGRARAVYRDVLHRGGRFDAQTRNEALGTLQRIAATLESARASAAPPSED